MHTVENAVIIPVFTLIIVALISVSGYMHDRVVMKNILNQVSIECSKNMTGDEQKKLLTKSEKYIKEKTIFVKNISIKADDSTSTGSMSGDISQIICTADWPFKLDFFETGAGNINMSMEVYRNRSEQLIRKTNVMLHK